jgi:hypothetical protein
MLCLSVSSVLDMLQAYVLSVSMVLDVCFKCVDVDVVKVYRDVAYVTVATHVCCKRLFPMFHLFIQTYVASVFI